MVCEEDTYTNIQIPAIMLPQYAGDELEDLVNNNTMVSVHVYSPKCPVVDVVEVFLWLMDIDTIVCASYWSVWNAREATMEQEKPSKDPLVAASCFLVMLYKCYPS